MMASVPALIVLAALAGWGLLPIAPALTAGVATLVATGFIVSRWVSAVETLRRAVEALARDDGAAAPSSRHIAPIVSELWFAIVRLIRILRDQVRSAEGRLAAAEAVISPGPGPPVPLDGRRRGRPAPAPAGPLFGPPQRAPRPPPPPR